MPLGGKNQAGRSSCPGRCAYCCREQRARRAPRPSKGCCGRSPPDRSRTANIKPLGHFGPLPARRSHDDVCDSAAPSRLAQKLMPASSAWGLGRVITRRRGYGRAATGEVCCKVTVSIKFFRFRSGRQPGSSSGHSDQLSGCAEVAAEPSQAAIAAISGLTPTMFMTRVRL